MVIVADKVEFWAVTIDHLMMMKGNSGFKTILENAKQY